MNVDKVIKQLESIKEYSLDNADNFNSPDDNNIWIDDAKACSEAINIIKDTKKCNSTCFIKGIAVGSLVMLIFHFLWILKGGC